MRPIAHRVETLLKKMNPEQLDIIAIYTAALERKDDALMASLREYMERKRSDIEQIVYPDYSAMRRLAVIGGKMERAAWARLFYNETQRGDAPAVEFLNALLRRRLAN